MIKTLSVALAYAMMRVLIIVLCLRAALAAQETRTAIYGRVVDPSSSPVMGASVVVTNVETGVSATLATNETGYFEANLLLPGEYRLSAEAAGFKKSIRSGITLPTGTRLEIGFALEMGAVTESISVTAEAPLLDTSTSSSGWVLDNRNVMALPMLTNNATLLAKLTPGVFTPGINQYGQLHAVVSSSQYSVSGNVGGNEWSIDGAPNNGRDRNVGYVPYADTVQEMKVETSNFDAPAGHTTGVTVARMTKSGTSQFHGTATWQHWQNRGQGAPFFTKQVYYRNIAQAKARGDMALADRLRSQPLLPSGHSNNYAATLGGPIVKEKLFFFFGFNGYKEKFNESGLQVNYTIPTMANRQGDFSQLLNVDPVRYQIYDPLSVRPDPARPSHYIRDPIPSNVLPAARVVNSAYKAYAGFLPTPNSDPLQPNKEPLNNYVAPAIPWNFNAKTFSNRVDYNISDKDRFFGRWGFAQPEESGVDWTFQSAPGLHANTLQRRNRNLIVDWVHLPSSRTVLDVSFSTNEYRQGQLAPAKPSAADVGLPAYLDAKAGQFAALPTMSVSGYQTIGIKSQPFQYYRLFSYKADVAQIRSAHSLRAGFDARQRQQNGSGGSSNFTGAFAFTNAYTRRNDDSFTPAGDLGLSWAAFMMGLPSSMTIQSPASVAASTPTYGWYGQDDWRVNSKLTLNLGLRMEYELGPLERFNRVIGWFDPQAELPITAAAQAAYALKPIPELPASAFVVRGGSLYPGIGGAGRRYIRNEFMWLPRFGVAYQLNSRTVLRAGYGLFFDTVNILNSPLMNIDQTGFSRDTSTNVTNDFGATWLVGDPRNGISPLRDPFPVRPDGTRFDAPLGSALGLMARVGRGWSFYNHDMRRARQQRWRVALQHQFGNNMVFEAAYAASYSDHVRVDQSKTLSYLPQQYWATGLVRNDAIATNLNSDVPNPFLLSGFADLKNSNPLVYADMATQGFFTSSTIRKNQLLRAYPQMNGIAVKDTASDGEARADALELSFARRLAKGFSVNAAYTRLRLVEADYFYNEFDAKPSWRSSNDGRPHRLSASGIWELPFGPGRALARRGPLGLLFGGWQIGWTYEFQTGPLITFGNLFYYGDLGDIAKGPHTLAEWFNTNGFERNAAKGPANFH